MLKVIENEVRQVKNLDGIWKFKLDKNSEGFAQKWFETPLKDTYDIAVPGSYNDQIENENIRDHIGDVWYETTFRVPRDYENERIVLRFGSITHRGTIFLDGCQVAFHQGGYTPIEVDITDKVKANEVYRLTVCVNNELSWETIPPGNVILGKAGHKKQYYFHDFFNYAGIHRSVLLYSTPKNYVKDIDTYTTLEDGKAFLHYSIECKEQTSLTVSLLDENGKIVCSSNKDKDVLEVENPHLWEVGEGYLYTLKVKTCEDKYDIYDLNVGLRTVQVKGHKFLINNKPFYFKGFGRHEDSFFRGKGFDNVVMIHDHSLMKWIGANSYRTSHYPYAEEMMDYADKHGIVVIDETPAVGINMGLSGLGGDYNKPKSIYEVINENTQKAHAQVIEELINRDKNHPCVVMWSIMNEPDSIHEGCIEYFEPLTKLARSLDPEHRPLTYANETNGNFEIEKLVPLFDVISLNRYYGWYFDTADLKEAEFSLRKEINGFVKKFDKPIIFTEYGTDTMNGVHSVNFEMWTEEFQSDFLKLYHKVFDESEAVIGEHIWNFADFKTNQSIIRVGGCNMKGVFTRERRPKKAAFEVRDRWLNIKDYNYKK